MKAPEPCRCSWDTSIFRDTSDTSKQVPSLVDFAGTRRQRRPHAPPRSLSSRAGRPEFWGHLMEGAELRVLRREERLGNSPLDADTRILPKVTVLFRRVKEVGALIEKVDRVGKREKTE